MATNFFVGWALWEKMTFVLAGAIVLTFAVGFSRLWWLSRRTKKHTILDEEKRAKLEEMRMSGQIIETKEEDDPPFGIRALESGIQVDGIWVSRSNTPLPESLRSLQNSDRSIDSSVSSQESNRSISPGERPARDDSLTGLPLPTFRQSRISFEGVAPAEAFPPVVHMNAVKQRDSAYKPRRSSQLRFSSYSDIQVHKDTLSQLEGATTQKQPGRLNRDRSSYTPILADSEEEGAADNERSSGTDSDETLSGRVNRRSLQSGRPPSSAAFKKENIRGKLRVLDESADLSLFSSTQDYFRVTLEPPLARNPFATQDMPPLLHPTAISSSDVSSLLLPVKASTPDISPMLQQGASCTTNKAPESKTEALGESQWPILSNEQSASWEEPTFVPGTLHVNKSVRKVNSGFEVLPAGTFDAQNGFVKGASIEIAISAPGGTNQKRLSRKLKKRRR